MKPEFDKEFTFSKVLARRQVGEGHRELFISDVQEKTLHRDALARLWDAHAAQARESDPGETGCTYADQELLPAMRQFGRFIDQEAFDSA